MFEPIDNHFKKGHDSNMRVNIYIHKYIYIYIHICTYMYLYIHIYMSIHDTRTTAFLKDPDPNAPGQEELVVLLLRDLSLPMIARPGDGLRF